MIPSVEQLMEAMERMTVNQLRTMTDKKGKYLLLQL